MTATRHETDSVRQQQDPAVLYESHFVTHMFRPFARDLVARAVPQPGERVLAVAQERAEAEGVTITWQTGNAHALPFDNGAFDLVVCQQGLQYFPYKVAALREMRRVVVPGGRAVISCWSPFDANPVNRIFNEIAFRHLGSRPGPISFGLGGAEVLRTLVHVAGFAEAEVIQVGLTVCWPSYPAYLEQSVSAAAATVPALAALSPDERAGLVRAYEQEATPRIAPYLDGEALNMPLQTDFALARA